MQRHHQTLRHGFIATMMAIACATPSLSLAQSANDQRIISTLNGQAIKALLAEEGYTKITVDKDDDLIFKIGGTNVVLVTQPPNNRVLTLAVSWKTQDVTLQKINEWNAKKILSRAYLDKDNEPVLEMDLDLGGGVTIARFKGFLEDAKVIINQFTQEIL